MKMRDCLIDIFIVLCLFAVFFKGADAALPPLTSGEFLKVGAPEGIGPLAAEKIINQPMGAAHVYGKAYPDLFLIGNRFQPDFLLFPWEDTAPGGIPVFGHSRKISGPDYVNHANPGTVFERDGQAHALWYFSGNLAHLVFDKDSLSFVERSRTTIDGLPRGPHAIGWFATERKGGGIVFFGVSDGTPAGPPMEGFTSTRDPRYDPYDGAGVWRGGFPHVGLFEVEIQSLDGNLSTGTARQATPTLREVQSSVGAITSIALEKDNSVVITGSHFGPLLSFDVSEAGNTFLESARMVMGTDRIALRHPTIKPMPVSYPNADGQWCDLLVGGEGGIYFYKYRADDANSGRLIYDAPVYATQRDADIYMGTLPVLNVVDWDGDGVDDIVSGNSEGRVVFAKNVGDNLNPSFLAPVPLEAGGDTIHIQPGYRGSIQGPFEARWGYTCPTVTDWDGNGLPDIVMSDATAIHRVYMNMGASTSPQLDHERVLYSGGLEVHGTWRVKPAVAKMDSDRVYVVLDDDDEFVLYRQIDIYNLEYGGKLRLESGEVMGANYLKSGGTGRIKITLIDWDKDGATDLLLGTPRHASVPDPSQGLPQSLGKPGAAVLLLRNVGTDKHPVFAAPQTLKICGEEIYFGQHACSPAPASFGGGDRNLLVGVETGQIYYFAEKDISFGQSDLK